MPAKPLSGDALLDVLSTLANPHRLRVLAALAGGRDYVSQIARELSMSRPLLQMHLKKLEASGLVTSKLELSDDGKAMNFYQLAPFSIVLDAAALARAAKTLTPPSDAGASPARKPR
ncbi:MAG: transcriptional regulator [Frankiales bacterium]|nr:transcriptional regulator [Frankiales bacterium]